LLLRISELSWHSGQCSMPARSLSSSSANAGSSCSICREHEYEHVQHVTSCHNWVPQRILEDRNQGHAHEAESICGGGGSGSGSGGGSGGGSGCKLQC